jgi:hypothetical protein
MNTNHRLSKPVMIGKVNSSGTFDVIWRSINPIRADAWNRYIPTEPSARPIGPFLGSAGDASSRHSRNGEGRFKATYGFRSDQRSFEECPRSHSQHSWQTGCNREWSPVGIALRGKSGAIDFRFWQILLQKSKVASVRILVKP